MSTRKYFDEPTGSAEWLEPMSDALAKRLASEDENRKSLLKGTWHKLIAKVQAEEDVIEFSPDDVESVEPSGGKVGTFLLHFKDEIVEHKGRTALVTGAAILACATSIHVAKKR